MAVKSRKDMTRVKMEANRGRRFLIWMVTAILALMGGCSTIPSPLIVGNTYTNFDYEFSLDLPSGWIPAEDPSDALAHHARWVDEDMATLVLIHEDDRGLIAVLNQKQELAYPRYMDLEEPYWEYRIDEMKTRLEAAVDVTRYDYQIFRGNLITTQQNYFESQRAFKPEKVFGVDARFVDHKEKKQMLFEWFLFPCQKNRSCQTIVMLTCPEDRYAENRPDFDHVVATLRGHDYYN
jgi:hypothetical protein